MTDRRHSSTREKKTEFIGFMLTESLKDRLEEYEDQREDNNRSEACRDLLEHALDDVLDS